MAKKRALADSTKDRLVSLAGEKKGDDGDLQNFNTRLEQDLITQMKVYCALNRMKIQEFVAEAIKEKLQASK